ncbi:MAG: hypothetical protein HY619_03105 [Thaumarchaeota archaeon]|nr:hypothetical protein [Nitrososphaerota archaeon]
MMQLLRRGKASPDLEWIRKQIDVLIENAEILKKHPCDEHLELIGRQFDLVKAEFGKLPVEKKKQ